MKCPKCKSKTTIKRGKRYNKSGTKQLYFCNNCEFTKWVGSERMLPTLVGLDEFHDSR